jgi:perosamine synthetase
VTTQAKDDPVEYTHKEIGYNYRLTNIQAALGCAQMEQLDSHIAAKLRIAHSYRQVLDETLGLTPMKAAPWASAVHWLYTVLVDQSGYGMSSRALLTYLASRGIETRPLWEPLHNSRAHRGSPPAECPVAERIAGEGLSLPSSVGLTAAEQKRVIEALIHAAAETGRIA